MTNHPQGSPNPAQIEELLRSIRPHPGQRFHQRMAQAPWVASSTANKGVFKMNRKYRVAAFAVVILVLVAIMAATPIGGAFARGIMHFFNRTQGNTVQLPPDQVLEPVPSATPEPTHALALQPAGQIAEAVPTETPTPSLPSDPGDLQDLSLVGAETYAGFRLYAPARLPRDYRLTRISYDPAHQAVSMQYASPQAGSGEFFQITQGKTLEPLSIGPDAPVETIPVGEYTAELVRGQWFVANGASQATWEGGAEIYTLRWQAEDVTISVEFFLNETFSPAYLERGEMLALARDLVRCKPGGDYACEVGQAAAAAGFTPWQFPAAPAGLSFSRVDYRPGLTALGYGGGMGNFTFLQSTHDFAAQEENYRYSFPADAIQDVTVSAQPGEYVKGQFIARPGETEANWDADAPVERLRWKNGGWWFQVVRFGSPGLEAQPLAALAGQLTGDTAQVQASRQQGNPPESDPMKVEAYLTIAEVEAVAGFDVHEPDVLPEGMPFSHARYEPLSGSVMLFYGDFAADKIHANGPVLLISQMPDDGTLDKVGQSYPPEAIQAVEVRGNPGFLVKGMLEIGRPETGGPTPTPAWNSDSGSLMLAWAEGGMQFGIHFDPIRQGARLGLQDLLRIAESIR